MLVVGASPVASLHDNSVETYHKKSKYEQLSLFALCWHE